MWLLNLDKWCAPGFCSFFMCLVLVAGVMGLKCEVSWENNEIAIFKKTQEEEEIVRRRSSVGFVLACASEKYVYQEKIRRSIPL